VKMIKPMSVEDIKVLVSDLHRLSGADLHGELYKETLCCLILAWAHERARANAADKKDWESGPWLNVVLDELNWPKDVR